MSESRRATWCLFCHPQTSTDDLELLHPLEAILPEYEHSVCSFESLDNGKFKASIKLKISAEEEVRLWLEAFQSRSKTIWRFLKTYKITPETARTNKYRMSHFELYVKSKHLRHLFTCLSNILGFFSTFDADLRCLHGGSTYSSKRNTSCPALLYLVLKKDNFSQKRRSRSCDPHIQNKLTFHINFQHTHNHDMDCPVALRHRPVSKETVTKLEMLFESGHTPSSAIKILKRDLQEQMGESYAFASADRSVCPDLSFCYRLYYKRFNKKCRKKKTQGTAEEMHIPATFILHDNECYTENLELWPDDSPPTQDGADLELRLQNMFEDLLQKLRTNTTFQEPIKAMVSSYESMTSDRDLLLGLCRFGKPCLISAANQFKIKTKEEPALK